MAPISYRCTLSDYTDKTKSIQTREEYSTKWNRPSAVLKGVCACKFSVSLCTFSLALTLVSSFISVQSVYFIQSNSKRFPVRFVVCFVFFFLYFFSCDGCPVFSVVQCVQERYRPCPTLLRKYSKLQRSVLIAKRNRQRWNVVYLSKPLEVTRNLVRTTFSFIVQHWSCPFIECFFRSFSGHCHCVVCLSLFLLQIMFPGIFLGSSALMAALFDRVNKKSFI